MLFTSIYGRMFYDSMALPKVAYSSRGPSWLMAAYDLLCVTLEQPGPKLQEDFKTYENVKVISRLSTRENFQQKILMRI